MSEFVLPEDFQPDFCQIIFNEQYDITVFSQVQYKGIYAPACNAPIHHWLYKVFTDATHVIAGCYHWDPSDPPLDNELVARLVGNKHMYQLLTPSQ